jgi:hypothetical protein
MEDTPQEYMKLINKSFKQIGKMHSTPKIMSFTTDGLSTVKEEHPGTFSSMNFVWSMITQLPGKYYGLMSKQQAIRFIRVAKQRVLKVIDVNIDFITWGLSQYERSAFDRRINETFITNLTEKMDELTKKYHITDKDLYRDNPAIMKKYMVLNHTFGSSPENAPSSNYTPITDRQYKEVFKFNTVGKAINEFRVDMDGIDEADKVKYTEDDTPDIIWTLNAIKNEYLELFKQRIYTIEEKNYSKEIAPLNKEMLKRYKERLDDIRKSAHNPKIGKSRSFTQKNTYNSGKPENKVSRI